MDKIGRIIFNALVSRRDIWLPCVGTFRNEYIPARDNGDGTVTPPNNRIIFIEGHGQGAFPVTDMISQEPGGETAEVQYDRWLAKATERGPVIIEGIGVINNGVFTPYESLIRQLNPVPQTRTSAVRPAGRKGLGKTEKIWLALIALFIVILAGGWTWWHMNSNDPSGHSRWNARNPAATDNMEVIPQPTGSVDQLMPSEEGQFEEEQSFPEEELFIEPVAKAEVQPVETSPVQSAAASAAGSGYYVVGGVFAVPGNADKYIREMSAKYPDLDYVKHPYPGGKTLVSLRRSADEAAANRERRRIEDLLGQYDLWVYAVK